MLKKGQITQEDYDKLIPDVELKGPAKLMLKNTLPLPADSSTGMKTGRMISGISVFIAGARNKNTDKRMKTNIHGL